MKFAPLCWVRAETFTVEPVTFRSGVDSTKEDPVCILFNGQRVFLRNLTGVAEFSAESVCPGFRKASVSLDMAQL